MSGVSMPAFPPTTAIKTRDEAGHCRVGRRDTEVLRELVVGKVEIRFRETAAARRQAGAVDDCRTAVELARQLCPRAAFQQVSLDAPDQ